MQRAGQQSLSPADGGHELENAATESESDGKRKESATGMSLSGVSEGVLFIAVDMSCISGVVSSG